ncbi:PQQ-binding-like beta-propeller repeat protein [Actinomadura violacea]|uniref:PQQ-binding-like beta-propeller repeat protein n=1 Tax=Actinomadura violacea TaxID=2819934 RepID=A0ABS3S9Z3_9ACTN|nr:PQQ-binding-like beta-propeller repeat protein [Actinomadura violacea]MBO2465832.1 PQQ-binding-like beta-propeller repeat protein [Actinomadura violacea]
MTRRTVLQGMVLAGAVGLAGGCGGNPDLSTKATGRKPLWKHTFTTADDGYIKPGPTDLFPYSMTASDTTFYASYEGKLYAFDTAGRQLWQSPYGHYDASPMYGRTTPLVMEGTLYTIRNEPGGKGTLQALDPGTGRLRWSFSPGGPLSPPAASGGHVAVSSTAHLHCLDARTGKERWRAGGGPTRFPGAPAIADGVVCAVDAQMFLEGLDAATGRTRWHRSGGPGDTAGLFEAQSSITSDGDTVYLHAPSGLWAVSAHDGELRWSGTAAGGLTRVTPASGLLYVAGSDGVSAIAAGRTSWTVPVPHWAAGGARPLALADGTLAYTTDGRVAGLDTSTGTPRWTATVKDYTGEDVPLSNPAAANHVVCVLAKDQAATDDAGDKDGPVNHIYAFPA